MKSENLISPRFNIPSPLMGEGREGVGAAIAIFLTFPRKGEGIPNKRGGVTQRPAH
jgi:hypothetical protein